MYCYSYITMHTYDKANQLVSSTTDGKVTHYAYDAAGRLIKEGDKSYVYGWLDKVLSVTENGKPIASFNYHNDGQIAQAIHNGKSEDFLWDGLALIHRGKTSFINEPSVTADIKRRTEHVIKHYTFFAAQNRVATGNIGFINK